MKKYFSSMLKNFVPPETCKSPPDSKWRQFASTLPYAVRPEPSRSRVQTKL